VSARTRFAPSPTGRLHLGHAFSALVAAGRAGPGGFLLRIEDIDHTRCRPGFERAILDDLAWLGLSWPVPVLRQSTRRAAHRAALERLAAAGLLYPCRCSRRDIAEALAARQEGAAHAVYPGTCRGRKMSEAGPDDALRLDMARALRALGDRAPAFRETGPEAPGAHRIDPERLLAEAGDIVLARRDIATSYTLAVVVDDARQGITEVTRGADLLPETPVQVLIQALLGLPTPAYHHHRLIRDARGRRLAKRDGDESIAALRAAGVTPAALRRRLGLPPTP